MDGDDASAGGRFESVNRDDTDGGAVAIRDGTADAPADWPARAVESRSADDENDYHDALHGASMAATRAAVAEAERAGDRQPVHAVRAMDDRTRQLVNIHHNFLDEDINRIYSTFYPN